MANRELPSSKDLRDKYPGNSYTQKDRSNDIQSVESNKPKAKQVASGKVRKQGIIRKLVRYLVADTVDTARDKVMGEVIIPGVQSLIYDAVVGTMDTVLYGTTERPVGGYRRASNGRKGGRISYDRYYDERNGRKARSGSYRNMPKDPDEIIMDTREDARDVLEELDYIIQEYGQASIADYYDIVGVTSEFTDNKFGWTSLRGASIKPVRDGHMIIMPRTERLDD